jgi:hypothetical protein
MNHRFDIVRFSTSVPPLSVGLSGQFSLAGVSANLSSKIIVLMIYFAAFGTNPAAAALQSNFVASIMFRLASVSI